MSRIFRAAGRENTAPRTETGARRTRNPMIAAVIVALLCAATVVVISINYERKAAVPAAAPVPAADVPGLLVRENSHRLGTAAPDAVTLVEFLDFECEACAAAFPLVEDLRTKYAGRVNFVVRYFPIPSHFNAERAARAVEAAAAQGAFEGMYKAMYRNQARWGEQRVAKDAEFRVFAQELGLDIARWEADYNDPATLDRVRQDFEDGRALGVRGTPTFFLDGVQLRPSSADEFIGAIDAALAE
ncbi:DsbA family protein [Nocardia sp. NPDC057668]|uniref:DsbA family protein n=1 Tax=Nocardia sp. NPDC057668 TaxID=3346202 RepID=UPI003671A145